MIGTTLAAAPLESARFGLNVHRGESVASPTFDCRQLLSYLVAEGVDVAILRGPAPFQPAGMERYGMQVLHADTLVHYGCDLARLAPRELRNAGVEFSLATTGDREQMPELVAATFESYRNHYHANPLFDPQRILEGYVEWAAALAAGNDPRYLTWVARSDGVPIGFISCRDDGAVGDVVLNGVHPNHAGAGLYSDLVRVTQQHFAEAGRSSLHVSTQVWNYAVQKVWSRSGFGLTHADDTWHVNSLLSAGNVLVDKEVLFTREHAAAFARLAGDAAPAPDGRASETGCDFDTPHALLDAGELMAILEMLPLRRGTLCAHAWATATVIRPVHPARWHRLRVTAIPGRTSQTQRAVAVLLDDEERPCLLAYCDLTTPAQ